MSAPASRPTPVPEIVGGVLLAAVSHGVLIALLVLATGLTSDTGEALEVDGQIVSAELLMWGEVMPEDGQLPWIANPEPAPPDALPPQPDDPPEADTTAPQQEVVNPTPPDDAEVHLEEEDTDNQARPEEHRPEATPRRDRGESNPNRPTNNDPRVGSTEGFAGGTSLSASAQRNQLAPITAQLSRALQRPTAIDDATYRSLSAVVQFRVSEAGRVLDWEIVEPSGNQLFDAAVSRMLNRFKLGSDRLNLSVVTNEAFRDAIVRRGFQTTVQGR